MSSCFLKLFYALVLLSLHVPASIIAFNNSDETKCIESERQALLNFKQSLIDHSGMLSTWSDDDNNTDCCNWKGIQCNNETGHVQMLHLPGHDTEYLTGAIDLTSLSSLQNIQHLDLSNNDFGESHFIPKLIGSFTNLRYLNLSYSLFGGTIPSGLGKLTHLRYLDLSGNYFYGELPYELGNLSQLRYLDLSENSFSGALPFQVGNLPMLYTLGLGGDFDVKSKDAEWFSNLHSLTNLALTSFHDLGSSHHWLQMISKIIPNLRELRLVDCSLLDTDVHSLFYPRSNYSTSLTILDLSSNMLTSSTFQLLFNFSHNLQQLYLSHNNMVLSSPFRRSFPSLTILDLSYNNMTSSVFQGSFNFSSKLQNLNLQNCSLKDGSFPMSYTSIKNSSSSLVSLDLSNNLLKTSTIFYWLFNYTTNLRILSLSGNLLEGPIPDGFGNAMNSLEHLDLGGNKLQGEIPSFFGNMCTLKELNLSNNKLNGDLSSFFQNSSWCNRHIFKTLDLSYNRITGVIPTSIGLLSELADLSLGRNYLEGDVTESHLSNFSKLKYLFLSGNSLSLKFVPRWVPPFQLESLGLRSCKLGPTFPSWLQSQTSLVGLDVSDNGLNDSVPEWIWRNSQHMTFLNMSHNNLNGKIPNISLKLFSRPFINLKSNQFEGKVPSFLLQASSLLLSQNKISDLFSLLCDQSTTSNLDILDLSHNHIKGQFPDCWSTVNSLLILDLSHNKLSRRIPMSMGSLVKLEGLILEKNNLTGELPSTLKNCSNLILLDLGENMLSGPIPSWIGESMQNLIILKLRENHFSGNIPKHLCHLKHIQLLDLSWNKLSEAIPTCLGNFTAMVKKSINKSDTIDDLYSLNNTHGTYFYYSNVTWMWKGVKRGFRNPEYYLKCIVLSNNKLTGKIPKEVGYLLGLYSLNLSRNNLSGEIPSEIGNLSSLESLDLSRNHLTGQIPSSLCEIDGLGKLDLSHNSLSGRIPSGRHFETFEASSFEGNIDLCGEQLNKTCPGDGYGDQTTTVKPQEPAVDGDNSVFYEGLFMSLGFGFFTGFWGLLGSILLWRPWRNAYIRFLNRFTTHIYEWLW